MGTVDPYWTLTSRERQVLPLVANGSTSTEIGLKLGISPRTVKTRRAHLMRELGLPAFKFFGIGRVLGRTANE